MSFLEWVGFLAIVTLLAFVFIFVFKDVKGRIGRRLIGVLFLVVLATVISKGEEIYGALVVPSPTPTRTRTPRPTPTKRVTPTQVPCFRWDEISRQMNGKNVCVYGIIQSTYSTNEAWTRVRFTSEPNNFFLFSAPYVFSDMSPGNCVLAYGTVELYEEIPFVEADELYYCEEWMLDQ